MIRVPITFVHQPLPTDSSADTQRYARFIGEVEHFAGVSVRQVQGSLRDVASSEGIILMNTSVDPVLALDEFSAAGRAELAARLVPISESRIRIFERLLEPLSLPAAIDTMTFMEWESDDPNSLGARGPYGRRDVGHLVGASCLLFESERYCYLQSPTHHGLPHLLADYLTAYANDFLA
jgi:hypothetical protein